MRNLTILILAAGSSKRLGQPKQLVKFQGHSLLQRTVTIAYACTQQVAVVLGSQYEQHHQHIAHLDVAIIPNAHWQKGMGNSLKAGMLGVLSQWPATTEVIVLVCDQPRLTSDHLQRLIKRSGQSSNRVICSSYLNTLGVPALFKNEMFGNLLSMADSEGAKKLIQQNLEDVDSIYFEGGELDIDTPDDLQKIT
ncbi:MAG: NTP transferase domain-containing protein [Cytophagales bacterium]